MDGATLDSEQAILAAAIEAFGLRGLEGASTRDIARAAGKPMSAITYHFNGKNGLYLACAAHIAGLMGAKMSPALEAADAMCADAGDAAGARAALAAIFRLFVEAMLSGETAIASRFIVREQIEPTEAFDVLWGGVMGALLNRIAALLVTVSGGRLPIAEARVRTVALMGSVIGFRVARATVLRLTGWTDVGPKEGLAIHAVAQAHLTAILDSLQTGDAS